MAKTVHVGMSGGVDSSVTAILLKELGYHVAGVYMNVWGNDDFYDEHNHYSCYGPQRKKDINEVDRIAKKIGIDLQVFDVSKEYKKHVLDYFSKNYIDGKTPNPCIECNKNIKFGVLIDMILGRSMSFDFFATGHYVNIHNDKMHNRYVLKKAKDKKKDQSYFLYGLSQNQLSKCIFPLGQYCKNEIREIARTHGLGLDEKKESQNFVNGDYSFLIQDKYKEGNFINKDGVILGKHRGIPFYTIGQRKGLGIAFTEPLYVVGIDAFKNQVMLGVESDLFAKELIAKHMNWIAIDDLRGPMQVTAKIRYGGEESEAEIFPEGKTSVRVQFKKPQKAITPGQSVVFYDGDNVVGGGEIQ
ncbi:MAG: tRNA 2-thiouridine(34) synthase MnmA [Candidatus Margulisbacteria bacterium GWF2_35_9]|nr:MAG: tRNA 2-thiouridine(34) synthase MnmA [Candidatus Margulisbacteria bacterium GWF2_35_9]